MSWLYYLGMTKEEKIKFFRDGYVIRKFSNTPAFQTFKKTLLEIKSQDFKEGDYFWKVNEVYRSRCLDFKPNIYTFRNNLILEMFKSEGIPEIMSEITGLHDLTLGHVKLRWQMQGKNYTSWHRDTNYYGGATKGAVPPLIGLNYYPCLGEPSEPVIKVWPGSHHLMRKYAFMDTLAVRFGKPDVIYTNDDEYAIFDTSAIHDLFPIQAPTGAMRVISQFARTYQLDRFPGLEDLHELYKKL